MADRTNISWCDSTFNPWIGCQKVSPGCDNCYAERDFDHRRKRVVWGAGKERKRTSAQNWITPLRWNAWPFFQCNKCNHRQGMTSRTKDGDFVCERCGDNDWKDARRRVFCASLSDWLDNEVPAEWLANLLDLIRQTPNLDWLLLTKRIGNFDKRLGEAKRHIALRGDTPENGALWKWLDRWLAYDIIPPHVWIGATVVSQAEADRDIPKLLDVPARVRFLSMEPLLGPVNLRQSWRDFLEGWDTEPECCGRFHCGGCCGDPDPRQVETPRIDWVVVGGESGPQARPMHPQWARDLRDQCKAAGVPFHFKQWGEWAPGHKEYGNELPFDLRTNSNGFEWYEGEVMTCKVLRVGKKAAGRLLDGALHQEFPA